MDREEFATERRTMQDEFMEVLLPLVEKAKNTDDWNWVLDKAKDLYASVFTVENGKIAAATDDDALLTDLLDALRENFRHVKPDSDAEAISLMIALAVMNSATAAVIGDRDDVVQEWVTMHDNKVRPAHAEADGQQRYFGESFDIGGHPMPYPGWPVAPVELWINCRCVLRAVAIGEFSSNSPELGQTVAESASGDVMEDTEVIDKEVVRDDIAPTPWHGVLAPEGIKSGDGRMFAEGSLRNRDLPLPLTWQKVSADGHNQNVTVAKIEKMEKIDGLVHASGHFLPTVEADEVVALIAEFGRYGVSVDADEAVAEYGDDDVLTFSDARISAACIVSIPAFAEAYVSLGYHPVLDVTEEEDVDAEFREVSEEEREKRANDGTAMDDGSYPIANCSDLKNAIQAIGRAKDPEATKSHIRKRAAALECPDVEIPRQWALLEDVAQRLASGELENWSDIEQFKDLAPGKTEDGPGWLTHPVDTDRLRDYWVRGPGAAKIAWGTPGDFNRCRVNVAEYVKPQYLSGYCANRHFDALGFWPGEHHAGEAHEFEGEAAPAVSIVASGGWCAPSEWFKDPKLTKPTSMSFREEERGIEVWGHLAQWGVCHLGISGVCTEAPPSASDYAYFMLGQVDTDEGPVRVGNLTIATGHAAHRLGARPTIDHYDNTGNVWADVAVGEDEFGIWYHGWVRPTATEEQIYAAKASGKVSGDWREIVRGSGELELVAALSVNTEGFQKLKVGFGIEDGRQVSLTAAGVVEPEKPSGTITVKYGLSEEDRKEIASAVVAELAAKESRKRQMEALREKVKS
jgi:hypothetical protein